jgi:imidazole glycerol-phosphate synthase subunit HisF
MLKKRILPCLDIRDGRTVKGVNFVGLRDAGDPVALARSYAAQGADELVLLDITATVEGRGTLLRIVEQVAEQIDIPFTVGGGIRAVEDAAALLKMGADKVSVNSAAVRDPQLIARLADKYGSQCVVVAVDTGLVDGEWHVFTHGGRQATPIRTLDWVVEAARLGAGELLLTSMENDGTKGGFAVDLTRQVGQAASIPVIASGGAGTMAHFAEVFTEGEADAALAASIFHFGEIPIPELKRYLHAQHIPIRWN